MSDTKIQWTDRVWNPVRGCSRVSPGCDHCYAIRQAVRSDRPGGAYEGLTTRRKGRLDWSGVARYIPSKLMEPFTWSRPARVFVNSMSDLFHHSITDANLDDMFAVMMICCLHELRGGHTFQILTKRPKRMLAYLSDPGTQERVARRAGQLMEDGDRWFDIVAFHKTGLSHPLIWLGVSVENQATADERIPLLLQTPAAVRWISYEPALGPVDFGLGRGWCRHCNIFTPGTIDGHSMNPASPCFSAEAGVDHLLDWIVVGGESGPGARPFDVEWARSTVAQCGSAGTACFVKQLGAAPTWNGIQGGYGDGPSNMWPGFTSMDRNAEGAIHVLLKDRHGGEMAEWPADIRVREYPRRTVTA